MAEEKRIEDLAIKKPLPPKPVVEKIPEKIYKVMKELSGKKGQLLQQMLNVSVQRVKLEITQKELVDKLESNAESYRAKLQDAFNKLRLKKRKNYRWGYNGKDAFIGTLIPEKPKKK